MLERIRQIAHNPIFKIFFLILAAVFAFSLGDFNKSKHNNIVAIVGKEKISFEEFQKARNIAIHNLNQQQHLTPQQAQEEANNINRSVLNRVVSESLIKQELKHLGIQVAPETIAAQLHQDPTFHKNGAFDLETYKKVLEYNHITEEQLLKNISSQVASKLLLDSLIVNLPLKNSLTDYLYNYLSEKRNITLVNIDASKINLNNFPEKDLKEYYNKHKQNFQSKEYRSFTYLLINNKNLNINTQINDETLEKEYTNNKEDYALPEMRDFHHFLTPDQETANQISSELNSNPNHEKVAANFISKKVISEKFTNQNQQSFLNSIDSSLFKLRENEITKVVKSDLGLHIFKVTKIHPKKYKSFTEAKTEVKNNLQNKLAESEIFELSKQVEDEIASGAEFKDIATKYNLIITKVSNIAQDGATKEQKSISIDPKILETAFEINANEESSIKILNDNLNLFVLKVESIEQPHLIEFESVKDAIKNQISTETKNIIAAEAAKILQIEASKNQSNLFIDIAKTSDSLLKSLYAKYNLSDSNKPNISVKNKIISRPFLNENNDLPQAFTSGLFNLSTKKASNPFNVEYAKYSFAIVQSIIPEKEKKAETYKQAEYISEINYKNEIYDQYLEYLRKKYPVDLNLKLINNKNDE